MTTKPQFSYRADDPRLYFNYRGLDAAIGARYGQLAATAVFLLLIAAIWAFVHFIL